MLRGLYRGEEGREKALRRIEELQFQYSICEKNKKLWYTFGSLSVCLFVIFSTITITTWANIEYASPVFYLIGAGMVAYMVFCIMVYTGSKDAEVKLLYISNIDDAVEVEETYAEYEATIDKLNNRILKLEEEIEKLKGI